MTADKDKPTDAQAALLHKLSTGDWLIHFADERKTFLAEPADGDSLNVLPRTFDRLLEAGWIARVQIYRAINGKPLAGGYRITKQGCRAIAIQGDCPGMVRIEA